MKRKSTKIRYSDIRAFLGHYHRLRNRTIAKSVSANMKTLLGENKIRKRSVWGVALVRNEADIIEKVVHHQLAQGISPLIIADNGSTDSTLEILKRLATQFPIIVLKDNLVAYHQAEKMTYLARLAAKAGATWIVPFDADEMWFAQGTTVAKYLTTSNLDVCRAELHNVFPSPAGWKIDTKPDGPGKVAFRASRFALLKMGNHGVLRSGPRGEGLYIAHFPWRSEEQVRSKIMQGVVALDAAGHDNSVGAHWRAMLNSNHDSLAELWNSINFQMPHPQLKQSTTGPFMAGDPSLWLTWNISEKLQETK